MGSQDLEDRPSSTRSTTTDHVSLLPKSSLHEASSSSNHEASEVKSKEGSSSVESTSMQAGDVKTFANTIISFIGSGVLGLPYAFQQAGFMLGLGTLIGVALVSTYSMLLLVRCKYALKEKDIYVRSYGEIGQIAYGQMGAIAVDVSLVISQSGFCIAYLIFIATNVHTLFDIPKVVVILWCIPALILLSFIKHLKQLGPFAIFADIVMIIGLAVVYVNDFEYMPLDHDEIHFFNFNRLTFFFGVATYCFEGVGMILPLEHSMKNKHNFSTILISTVSLVTCIYATFGLCGYLAFGEDTKDLITLNMPGSVLSKIVKLSLCVGLYFTYPMMLFPVFSVLESYWISDRLGSPPRERKVKLLRMLTVVMTAVVAYGIPNFGLFISFVGSTCCSLLAFILPALFYYKICGNEIGKFTTAGLGIIIVLGLVSLVLGLKEAMANALGS